jgi:hypothetical protein
VAAEKDLAEQAIDEPSTLVAAKRLGLGDGDITRLVGKSESDVRAARIAARAVRCFRIAKHRLVERSETAGSDEVAAVAKALLEVLEAG